MEVLAGVRSPGDRTASGRQSYLRARPCLCCTESLHIPEFIRAALGPTDVCRDPGTQWVDAYD